jgi:hypothetical protein
VERDYASDIPPASFVASTSAELPKELYFKLIRLMPLSDRVTRQHQRRVSGILRTALQRQKRRNEGLYIAALCLREFIHGQIVTTAAAEQLLLEAAVLNGYLAKDGIEAARSTIRSGLQATSEAGGDI